MRAFIALLVDSFRQAVDQKIMYILIAVSLLFAGIALTLGFTVRPLEEVARNMVTNLNIMDISDDAQRAMASFGFSRVDENVRVEEITGPDAGGRISFTAVFENRTPLAREADRRLRRIARKKKEKHVRRKPEEFSDGELADYVALRLAGRGAEGAEVKALPAAPTPDAASAAGFHGRVTFHEKDLIRLPGSHRVSFLFGLIDAKLPFSVPKLMYIIEVYAVNLFAGFFGIIIAIIVTAGFIPAMLKKGHIDFLVSRPITRAQLLVAKYLGGLTFVALNGLILIGSIWLALSLVSGYWSWWPLLTVVVLVYFFAVLYGFSVLIGVVTRSTLATVFLTLGFWVCCFGVNTAHQWVQQLEERNAEIKIPAAVNKALEIAYTVLPKTSDLGNINGYCLARAYLEEESSEILFPEVLRKTNYLMSVLTTGAFTAFLLFLAWLRLRRRDF